MRQRNHAIRRCAERYGVVLSILDYVKLCDRIWVAERRGCGNGVFAVTGFKRPKFLLYLHRVLMLVGWDAETCQINTFLSRSDRIEDRERIIAIRDTPIHLRWKVKREDQPHDR